ncbi:MAG: hypothetical protein ABEH47_05695 [Haloferacaceae archaeon]
MTRDAAAVERRLRSLDAGACAALAADLWAARGFDTRREGRVVVATRRGESRVLYSVPTSRVGAPPAPERPVDAVIDPRGRRGARELADAHGARFLDAAALREMLWYGVDRRTTADLCERHLGGAPADLSPPLCRRVRTAARRAESGVGAALVGALVLLVAGALVAPALTASPSDAAGNATATESGGVDLGAATASRPSGPSTVPGLDEGGVADLTALANAHRRAVEGESYTLWRDYRGPGEGNATIHRDVDVAVDGREYRAVTTVEGGNRSTMETVYHDRRGWFLMRADGGNVTYRRVGAGDGGPYGVPNPEETARTLVRRYLSTPETRVTGTVTRDGRTLYRVVGSGNPSGFGGGDVRNYTATALVGPDGFVVSLRVTYVLAADGRTAGVTREWTYGRVGETDVDEPEWYERRFRADDAGDD